MTGVTDAFNIEFNDRLFNLTIINIKVHKEGHLEFNFKDGSIKYRYLMTLVSS